MDRVHTAAEVLEVLGAEQCLELLATSGLGRIAVSIGAVPAIFPVHYRLIDGQIVFRTGQGTNLHIGAANTVVAFEVDDVDEDWRRGWSVLVVGVARDLRDVDAVSSALQRAPDLWESGAGAHVIAIQPGFVSGRRFPQVA